MSFAPSSNQPQTNSTLEQASKLPTGRSALWDKHAQHPNQTFQPSVDYNPSSPDHQSKNFNYKDVKEITLHSFVLEDKYQVTMSPAWNIKRILDQVASTFGPAILKHPSLRDYAWAPTFESNTAFTDAQHNAINEFEFVLKATIVDLIKNNNYPVLERKPPQYTDHVIDCILQIIRVAPCYLNLAKALRTVSWLHEGELHEHSNPSRPTTIGVYGENLATTPCLFARDITRANSLYDLATTDRVNQFLFVLLCNIDQHEEIIQYSRLLPNFPKSRVWNIPP